MPIASLEDQYANLSPFFKAQQRTFIMWMNGKLIEGGNKPVSTGATACSELMDGAVTAHLLQCLTSSRISGINWKPRNPLVISANWSILFKFMDKEKIKLGGVTSLSLSQGLQKAHMALIWRFIQKYDLTEVIDGIEQHGGIDGLLEWIKPRVEKYRPDFHNFTSDLKDGVALLALYDSIFPNDIDMAAVDPNKDKDNLQQAFDLFEEKLGVPQLIRPEDVTGKNETKNQNVTYILQIRNAVKKMDDDGARQKELDEKKKNDEESRRKAENEEHNNNGDRLYKEGLTKMGATNQAAEETVDEIMNSTVVEKCANIGATDAEYDQMVQECEAILDACLEGFDVSKDKFGEAKEEYGKIKPPSDYQPTPEEKMGLCDEKRDECDRLKEEFKLEFKRRMDDAIRNDKGRKKFADGVKGHEDGVFEGGEVLNRVLDKVKEDFAKSTRPEQRDKIGEEAEKLVSDEADRIFDPVKGLFMEAEDLLDSPDEKDDCRKKMDEVDASKAQMLQNIRMRIAELKAESGEADELTPDELLQLYHDTSNKIIGLLRDRDPLDEGIPADPEELKDRLKSIIHELNHLFGAKDSLRAKVHASVDEVFDRNGLP